MRQVLVDDDAVVQENAAVSEHVHRRLDADANHHEVAFQTQPGPGDNGGYTSCSFEPDHRVFEDGANPMTAMKVSDGLADRFPKLVEERCFRWANGDHVQTFLAERRRDFRADETHADDDNATAGNDLFPNAICVLNRAKAVDALESAPRNRHLPVSPARSDEQRVERHASMILELHDPVRWIDAYRSCAEDRLDVVVSVEGD